MRRLRPHLSVASSLVVLACTLALGQARAADAGSPGGIHGRLEVQGAGDFARGDSIDAVLGEQGRGDIAANLRLTWEPTWDRWSLSVHDVVRMEYGGSVRLARAEAGVLPAPPSTAFDLTQTFADHGAVVGTNTVDRLAITYSSPDTVVRVGRQALTWGSGLVFRPMDLFDPFSPSATDTEYKPGTDMLYVQRLFAGGADLQFIVAPRPRRFGEAPAWDESSAALHLHATVLGHQTTWLLARDHGDWVGGVGVNGAWGGATWNLELVPTGVNHGPVRVSAVANISDGVTLFHRNATVFAEYFHNGFGVAGGAYDLASLPPDLLDRLSRGQVFSTRRDYLSGGVTLEASPLLNVSSTLIAGLDDGSLFALFAGTYSLGDNVSLVGGLQVPVGRKGSEYGGLPLTPGGQVLLAPPTQIYLQLRRYF